MFLLTVLVLLLPSDPRVLVQLLALVLPLPGLAPLLQGTALLMEMFALGWARWSSRRHLVQMQTVHRSPAQQLLTQAVCLLSGHRHPFSNAACGVASRQAECSNRPMLGRGCRLQPPERGMCSQKA